MKRQLRHKRSWTPYATRATYLGVQQLTACATLNALRQCATLENTWFCITYSSLPCPQRIVAETKGMHKS